MMRVMSTGRRAVQIHVAHRSAQAQRDVATRAAMQTMLAHRRKAAYLTSIADRNVGDLPKGVIRALAVTSDVTRVRISARQQRHILHRRQVVSTSDADLCARRLSEALQNLQYHVAPQRDERVFELVGSVPSARRWLILAVKLVAGGDSKSGKDEWWIRTAFPFGEKKFKKKLARGELVEFPQH